MHLQVFALSHALAEIGNYEFHPSALSMKLSALRRFAPLLSLMIFAVALWVLDREIKSVHYHEIMQAIGQVPFGSILAALGFTLLSYALLTGCDALGLRYLGRALPYHRIALASFTSSAFSNTISFIMGAPLRYRMYTAWGFSTSELAKLILFGYSTFWLGCFTVTSATLLTDRDILSAHLTVDPTLLAVVGCAMAAAVVVYLAAAALRRRAIQIRHWEAKLPSLPLAAGQVVVSSLDWIASGAALYMLLPAAQISFPAFLAIFMFGHIAGIVSQVPGGLGVFESVVLISLSSAIPAPTIVASLLLFRVVYYLLPLSASAVLLGLNELLRYRRFLGRAARIFGQWFTAIIPQVLALSSFVGGTILLFSSATPAVHSRTLLLDRFIPLPVVELSHFFASVAGAGLLFVARGLQRRLDVAYFLTAGLLGFGILFSLLKGLDYEEASILGLMLLALLPCHRAFYRKSYLFREPFSRGWIIAVALVFITSVWLVFFSYKHVDYSGDLWWQFTLHGNASRSLRGTLGAAMVLLLFGLSRLVRPAPPAPKAPTTDDLELAACLTRQSPRTYGYLALLGDKSLLFSESRKSFIMYGVEGRSWVALGDPVGEEEEQESLVWQFRDLCERQGGWPMFYQVEAKGLPLYIDLGLTLIKLGEEARVFLPDFSLEGRANKNLRHTHQRAADEGCSFEIAAAADVAALLPEMKAVSDAWLATKNTREKGFSLGRFDESYLRNFPVAATRVKGELIGFANILECATKEELSVDLMRHRELENASVMDFMFIELMLWGKAQGHRWFNLGMAPLAGLGERALAPLWSKLGAFVFRHGENFYNFQGLYHYKNKFKPVWEPRYLASPGGLALPIIAANLSTLISGGLRGVVSK
jgi:phosphatidylglycerol lysyltransferase